MGVEFGKWPELCWASGAVDLSKAAQITAGIDIGTTSSQAVIMADSKMVASASIRTGCDFGSIARVVIGKAADAAGLKIDDIHAIAATGFGRRNVTFAASTFSEVQCHGKGARFMFGPGVTTVVDLGGQTVKAIRLHKWDRLRDFKISDKCAAGMGRYIEIMSDLLEIPIEEIGSMSLNVQNEPEPVSTTCYNFACPETIGLFRPMYKEAPCTENDVAAAYIFAVAWRILGTIGKLQPLDVGDMTVYREIAFTGGLAKNIGITKRLERELGVEAIKSEYDPQLAGAIGAALLIER